MRTQHQPNSAMQETTPVPIPASKAPAPLTIWDFLIFLTPLLFLVPLVFLVISGLIGNPTPVIYFQEPKCVFGICIDLPSPSRK